MNLAEHALKAIHTPPAGVSRRSHNPKKSARSRMEDNRTAMIEWVKDGATAVIVAERIELSVTSLWNHVDAVLPKPTVVHLRANGGKAATGLKLQKRSPFTVDNVDV